MTKFHGIMAHKDLEDKVLVDGVPKQSIESLSDRARS